METPQFRDTKTGVYICHCGSNIAGTVQVSELSSFASLLPGVAVARDYKYMCSSTGQEMIKEDIRERGVNRVVVAACSPRMHEMTFRQVLKEAGLNPYLLAVANIREHCSWIVADSSEGTDAAKHLIRAAVARVAWQEPLEERQVPVQPSCLVVGGGIAGIQAALSVAGAGYQVYLVEKSPSIGGRMAQLDKTFPTLDCSACILTPKMVAVARDKNVHMLTCSEVAEVAGYVGNFSVKVAQHPRYVDAAKCTGCGECSAVCPVQVPDEFDRWLSKRKAIYRSFPQAVPGAYTISKDGVPPCRTGCPAGVNPQGYVALIGQGKYHEALDLIRRDNPFASVCGRVCHHPCESKCRRGDLDEPVAIAALKRFVADVGSREPAIAETAAAPVGQGRVAVVGAGPAGLSAATFLARLGWSVTVFEALPVAGGMLAAGIPEYRLPRAALQSDIDYIVSQGVEIRTGVRIGSDLTLSDLRAQGYGAIFVAIGAHRGQRLGLPGEQLEGVIDGVTFLREVNLGHDTAVGHRTVVIGGGNTAIDAARTALRLGAEAVSVVYRRTRAEMPAISSEVKAAEQEGVVLEPLAAPVRFYGQKGRVTRIECQRMRLGEPDASGRPRPIPIPGSEFGMEADTVILAVGQAPDLSLVEEGLDVSRGGTLVADPVTMATSMPGIFAGGDAVTGPATVVEGVAAGRCAAESIDRYLRGLDLLFDRAFPTPAERVAQKDLSGAQRTARQAMPELPVQQRLQCMDEVELGFDEPGAREEAARCLQCATCSECGQCESVCGPKAIVHDMKEQQVQLDVGAIILATGHEFFDPRRLPQYNYGNFPNIIDSTEFERLCSASGPTGGEIRLADGRIPQSVCFIHCVGCRDSHANSYCSRLCCMHAMKQAHLVKEKTGADVYELYIDIRAGGKGYEEFYERVQREGVIFIRGRGAEVMRDGERLVVKAEDTGLGRPVTLTVDMVVLVTGLTPQPDSDQVARTFHITRDKDGFFLEAHPKLRPFETNTDGIYIGGTCQGPKDIPDTVAHASAAAAEVLSLLGRGVVNIEATTVEIDAERCAGCKTCLGLCVYGAISFDPDERVSRVNSALCKGCGVCAAACPTGAAVAHHFSDEQIFAEIEALLAEGEPVVVEAPA